MSLDCFSPKLCCVDIRLGSSHLAHLHKKNEFTGHGFDPPNRQNIFLVDDKGPNFGVDRRARPRF